MAASAERKHRALLPRRPTAGHVNSTGGARQSTAVIRDPRKRAEEMLRKAELSAKHHEVGHPDATSRANETILFAHT